MDKYYEYKLGYDEGFQDGRHQGYTEGAEDTMIEYETRIAKLYAELQELNARVIVVEKQ